MEKFFIFEVVFIMVKRRNILGILLIFSLLAALWGDKCPQPEPLAGNLDDTSSYFVCGSRPVADAQSSYIVAVPAAASMDAPSSSGIAEASDYLSEGQGKVFRCIRQRLPVPSDAGKRQLLLRVLRI